MKELAISVFAVLVPIAFWGWIIWLIVRSVKKRKAAKIAQAEAELAARREAESRRLEQEKQREQDQREYKQRLVDTYGVDTALRIVQQKPKIGDTESIIVEMYGHPVDTDTKQTTKKTTLTYKYAQKTKTQFGLTLKFDDGVLVEWEDKR